MAASERPRRTAGARIFFAVAVLAAFAGASWADDASVEFISPKHLQTIIGESRIELNVALPGGVRAAKVEIFVDDELLATLTDPPWAIEWDAGMTGQAHDLDAVLHLADGSEVRASIRTSPLRVTHFEEVALVNLYAVVRDRAGGYVTDLEQDDFKITENDRPQKIQRFETERKPLSVAIVIDNSLTMEEGKKLERAQEAALKFLDVLADGDECMVVMFSDDVVVTQELTAERKTLETAILAAHAEGGTALYDAVWKSSRRLKGLDGRRVLVLLSDGRDEASNGLEPGSLHTLNEALDRALRDEVIIFSIGIGKNLDSQRDFYGRRNLKSILEEMAVKTGGRALFASSSTRLKKAFEDVANDLRHMYSLAYVSDDKEHDGTWRQIHLEASNPKLAVYTRTGYFAPESDTSITGGY